MIDPSLGSLVRTTTTTCELIANVHPPNWRNPTPPGRYNLVVLGAGTAGLVAAAGAAGMGARVALVERHLMGGDCLNVGCVPSKASIRSGRAAADIRSAGRFGVRAAETRRRGRLRRGHGARAAAFALDISPHDSAAPVLRALRRRRLLRGGRLHRAATRSRSTASRLRFSKAVIATGARAVVPPIPGLADAGFLTNDTVFNLTELPARLAVIGGGPIGCELAQAFARLGSEVTIIEMADQIPGSRGSDAADVLRRLAGAGWCGRSAEHDGGTGRGAGGDRILALEATVRSSTRSGSTSILVAVGRNANVEGLDLAPPASTSTPPASRSTTSSGPPTAGSTRPATSACPHKFTHAADAASRAVLQNALFPGPNKRISRLVMPWCTYTDPEIAHVGLSGHEAAIAGHRDRHHHDPHDRRRSRRRRRRGRRVSQDPPEARQGHHLGATIVAATPAT